MEEEELGGVGRKVEINSLGEPRFADLEPDLVPVGRQYESPILDCIGSKPTWNRGKTREEERGGRDGEGGRGRLAKMSAMATRGLWRLSKGRQGL